MSNFISTVKLALRSVGYVASDELAAQIALLLASDGGSVKAMLLDGPPGAGKTALAKAVSKILGVEYIYVQAHPGSAPEDFLYDANIVQILRGVAGDREAVRTAEDVVELGFLPQIFRASQSGRVVAFVDELDKASPKTDSLFLAALQEGEVIVKGLGRVRANLDNLVLFFTKNDERQVSEPLMRRCRRAYLGFPSEELEMALLTGKVQAGRLQHALAVPDVPVESVPEAVARVLVTTANGLRARQEDLIKPPATQELIMAGHDIVRLAAWNALHLSGEITYGWLAAYQEDMQILQTVCSKQRLQEMLSAAARASAHRATSQEVRKCDDEFVAFGAEVASATRVGSSRTQVADLSQL